MNRQTAETLGPDYFKGVGDIFSVLASYSVLILLLCSTLWRAIPPSPPPTWPSFISTAPGTFLRLLISCPKRCSFVLLNSGARTRRPTISYTGVAGMPPLESAGERRPPLSFESMPLPAVVFFLLPLM
jgi:hypothetical protein